MSKNAFYLELLKQEQELEAALVSVRNLIKYFNVSEESGVENQVNTKEESPHEWKRWVTTHNCLWLVLN